MINRTLAALSLSLAATVTLSGAEAHADQCAWVPASVADRARLELSRPNATFFEFCQPCRDDARRIRVERVWSVTVRAAGRGGQHRELFVNGRPVDLAYLYVRSGAGATFTNLGQKVSCGARNVSHEITFGPQQPAFRPGFVCPPGSRC